MPSRRDDAPVAAQCVGCCLVRQHKASAARSSGPGSSLGATPPHPTPSQPLSHLQTAAAAAATTTTSPSPLSSPALYSKFTFTDELSLAQVNQTCPAIYALVDGFGKEQEIAGRLLTLFNNGSTGYKLLNQIIKSVDSELYIYWRYKLTRPRQLQLLTTLNESRQLYAHIEIKRAIPWEARPGGQVISYANQTCSWTLCVPKMMAVNSLCQLYQGVNKSIPDSFEYFDGKAAVVWDMFARATTRMQVGC
jgi:hypothetical protein